MYCIQLEKIYVYFNKICALEDISLNIKQGDFLAVIGPNGGGKTTLLKVIMGIIQPSDGSIIKDKKQKIGYVPQFTSFDRTFPINVIDVVMMGRLKNKPKLFDRYSASDRCAAQNAMDSLGILNLADRQISQLSGGEMQKVLIARALCSQPDVLLLDEPTANIDSKSSTEIYKMLKQINKRMTIVMVSHDIGGLYSYIKSVAYINRKLYYYGDAKLDAHMLSQVYGHPINLTAYDIGYRVLKDCQGV